MNPVASPALTGGSIGSPPTAWVLEFSRFEIPSYFHAFTTSRATLVSFPIFLSIWTSTGSSRPDSSPSSLSPFLMWSLLLLFLNFFYQYFILQSENNRLSILLLKAHTKYNVLKSLHDMEVKGLKLESAELSTTRDLLMQFWNSSPTMLGIVELKEPKAKDFKNIISNKATANFYQSSVGDMRNRYMGKSLQTPKEYLKLYIERFLQAESSMSAVSFDYEHTDRQGKKHHVGRLFSFLPFFLVLSKNGDFGIQSLRCRVVF